MTVLIDPAENRHATSGFPRRPASWGGYLAVNSPDAILIKPQAVDLPTCRTLCDYAATQQKTPTGAAYRVTNQLDFKGVASLLEQLLHTLFSTLVEPFYGVGIDWWETPQFLSYPPGGRYQAHSDGGWMKQADGHLARERFNRDISLICYLNDNFTGGLLHFTQYNFKIQPRPGLLVAFPSTDHYFHEAEPTVNGERLLFVTWATVAGSARIEEAKPVGKTHMKSIQIKN